MKQIKYVAFALLLSFSVVPACMYAQEIQLESAKLVDNFMTPDSLERVYVFMNKVKACVHGLKKSKQGNSIGHYTWNGKQYTMVDLADTEPTIKEKPGYWELLQNAKQELIAMAQQFFGASTSAKPMIVKMIEEDCSKRCIYTSVLLDWSKVSTGQEEAIFNRMIQDFKGLLRFCNELVQFLEDFVHNCPNAQKKLDVRMAKWNEIKRVLPDALKKNPTLGDGIMQEAFLRYLKKQIDTLGAHEINSESIANQLAAFSRTYKQS